MQSVFELIMLICFGLSWPLSVYKSYTSRSTKGKSLVFLIAILVGYVAGIAGKLVGGEINYVLILYGLNFCIVFTDLCLYFRNRRIEHLTAKRA